MSIHHDSPWGAAIFLGLVLAFPALSLPMLVPILVRNIVLTGAFYPGTLAGKRWFMTHWFPGYDTMNLLGPVKVFGIWLQYTDHMASVHLKVGEWCHEHLADSRGNYPTLAAFDIGLLKFIYPGRILDIGGLCEPEISPFLEKGDIRPYLWTRGVE